MMIMRKHILILAMLLFFFSVSSYGQEKIFGTATKHRQYNMAKWGIPGANYSGITYIGGNEYAVVNDKDEFDGFYIFNIDIDTLSGKIRNVSRGIMVNDYKKEGQKARDAEGVAYVPFRKSVFISAESDQRIVEQSLEGYLTGKEVHIPTEMGVKAIYGNYGFEALAYSEKDNKLWTVTENVLRADGDVCVAGTTEGAVLRLQSFDASTLQPAEQYAYRMDVPKAKSHKRQYAYGVSAMCALDDGSLLVMEREFYVAKKYIGSFVCNKIYRVVPVESRAITFSTNIGRMSHSDFVHKELVCEFKTRLNLIKRNLANYEGMCLGPRLADGKQMLILISDSQNNHGNKLFRMKDFIRTLWCE